MRIKRLVYLDLVSGFGLCGSIYLGATGRSAEGWILLAIANLAIGIDFGFIRLEAMVQRAHTDPRPSHLGPVTERQAVPRESVSASR